MHIVIKIWINCPKFMLGCCSDQVLLTVSVIFKNRVVSVSEAGFLCLHPGIICKAVKSEISGDDVSIIFCIILQKSQKFLHFRHLFITGKTCQMSYVVYEPMGTFQTLGKWVPFIFTESNIGRHLSTYIFSRSTQENSIIEHVGLQNMWSDLGCIKQIITQNMYNRKIKPAW